MLSLRHFLVMPEAIILLKDYISFVILVLLFQFYAVI